MPVDVAQEPGAEPTQGAQPAAPEPVNWQDQAVAWEKRAKGWQTQFQALQKEKEGWDTTRATLTQEATILKESLGNWEQQGATWEQVAQESEDEMNKLIQTNEQNQARLMKFELIGSEFPNLMRFNKFIPIGEEAEMREAMQELSDSLSETVSSQVQSGVNAAMRGVTLPASPARGVGVPSEEELAEILSRTAGVQGMEKEYNQALKLWGELHS